jgi:pimeloyl-ACP methyl ester carboxylesterase
MEQGYDQESTGVAEELRPKGVATEDYWLRFRVPPGLMPDRQFDGRPARLQVHRVYPVYEPGARPTVRRAVVLIHGRTVPGPVVFDLRGTDTARRELSVQKALALEGIDTFAPSLLGYGRSTRFDEGLNDPGNASLRAYPGDPDTPCQYPEGCDRTLIANINPLDQQSMLLPRPGSTVGNPLVARRAHSSNFHFARTDVWVRDIDQVIEDAIERARPTDRKVALVGYSLGGQNVGRTLYADNPNEHLEYERDKVIAKVSRVVFLNSFFGARVAGIGPTEERDPLGPPTFPLTLNDRSGSDDGWKMPADTDPGACPGRVIDGTKQQVWNQTMEQETMGREWGQRPWSGSEPTGGLNRAPTFSGYGWNKIVAGQLRTPTLVMQGLQDGVLPTGPGTGEELYEALPDPEENVFNKVLVQVECASHVLQWEGCDGPNCKPHHATFKDALIEWIKRGTFNRAPNGSWIVNKRGVPRPQRP